MRQEGFDNRWLGPGPWSASTWIEVLISQEKDGGEVVSAITINGQENWRKVNPVAEQFTNVDVYARDGVHGNPAWNSLMRGLSIQIGQNQEKEKILHGKL